MKTLYCWKHGDEEGVELAHDFNSAIYRCPREGCDTSYTHEYIVEHSCQRCGDGPDPDLRTLWMACLYEMNELGLPFEQFAVRGKAQKVVGYKENPLVSAGIPEFADLREDMEPSLYRFYLLRVCKDCRADWMQAIRAWFHQGPNDQKNIEDGDIPIRVFGATRRLPRITE